MQIFGKSEQVQTTGAQLFDASKIKSGTSKGMTIEYISEEQCFLINGTSESSIPTGLTYLNLPVDENDRTYSAKVYVLSGTVAVPEGKYAVAYFGGSDEPNTHHNWLSPNLNNKLTFTTGKCNYKYISAFWFYFSAGVVCNNLKVRIQLSKGSKEIPWEPYTGGKPSPSPKYPQEITSAGDKGTLEVKIADSGEKSQRFIIQTPNGLSGIPVSKDGNYTDENGQQWICDEIDLEKEVKIQKVGKCIFKGDEGFVLTAVTGIDFQGFALRSESINAKRIETNILCNYLISDASGTKTNSIAQSTEVYGIRFIISTDIVPNKTAEEFRAYLKAKYDSGKPVVVQYVLATPIETPLTSEEIAAYKSLHTYSGTTLIANDSGAGMSLTYTVDTRKYVDKKIAAISAAMIGG